MFSSSKPKRKKTMPQAANVRTAQIDANETYLKIKKIIMKTKRIIPAIIGDITNMPPNPVAIPFPPLKCKNILKQCPNTAKK